MTSKILCNLKARSADHNITSVLYFETKKNTQTYEPRHDKTNKVSVRPAKTRISLGIRPVWSESSLSTWRKLGSLATHWAHSEDWSDWMPRLIWVFAGHTLILLVLSCCSSYYEKRHHQANWTVQIDGWINYHKLALLHAKHHHFHNTDYLLQTLKTLCHK